MLELIDELIWSYAAVPLLIILGVYLTLSHRFAQFRLIKEFFQEPSQLSSSECETTDSTTDNKSQENIVSPWEAFFASLGGCIGIGNIIAVCTAIQVGGPGALIWMHIAAFLGMMIKYSEVFLSIKTRVKVNGQYFGGPFIYLSQSSTIPWLGQIFALLLAIYSVDVYMFKVVVDTIETSLNFPLWLAFLCIYAPLVLSAQRGIKVVGWICSLLIPLFLVIFVVLSTAVIFQCRDNIIPSLAIIFKQAFGLMPVLGGTVGASVMLTISEGVKRGCYSGDIGVGYAGLVHSKATYTHPKHQASYEVIGVLIDTFLVCTLSTFVIIVADTYQLDMPASQVLQYTLGLYFPGMSFFFPLMIVLLGFSTLLTFFYVGRQCLLFVFPQIGTFVYTAYSFAIFTLFMYKDQKIALTFMSLIGALLLLLNCFGLYNHRESIETKTKNN